MKLLHTSLRDGRSLQVKLNEKWVLGVTTVVVIQISQVVLFGQEVHAYKRFGCLLRQVVALARWSLAQVSLYLVVSTDQ